MLAYMLLSSLAMAGLSLAAPLKRAVKGPVISSDFPDPSIIKVGNVWYAFSSQSIYDNTKIHTQVATSTDFSTWTLSEGKDALPNLPSWAVDNGEVWAPDVNKLDDGTFIMYFSATAASSTSHHCVGTATSTSVTGPYKAANSPFACPLSQGGAIDASGFRDADGTLYVLYKIDGNSLGHGGSCGNTVAPIVPTPIMIQRVSTSDGVTKIGTAVQILTNGPYDGPLVEAPSLIRNSAGTYFLFFSSNCYSTSLYDVSYATAKSPYGPFTKSASPLLVTGTDGLTGPGGMDAGLGGVDVLFHGQTGGGRRALFAGTISTSNNVVSI